MGLSIFVDVEAHSGHRHGGHEHMQRPPADGMEGLLRAREVQRERQMMQRGEVVYVEQAPRVFDWSGAAEHIREEQAQAMAEKQAREQEKQRVAAGHQEEGNDARNASYIAGHEKEYAAGKTIPAFNEHQREEMRAAALKEAGYHEPMTLGRAGTQPLGGHIVSADQMHKMIEGKMELPKDAQENYLQEIVKLRSPMGQLTYGDLVVLANPDSQAAKLWAGESHVMGTPIVHHDATHTAAGPAAGTSTAVAGAPATAAPSTEHTKMIAGIPVPEGAHTTHGADGTTRTMSKDGLITEYPDGTVVARSLAGDVVGIKSPGEKTVSPVTQGMEGDATTYTSTTGVKVTDYVTGFSFVHDKNDAVIGPQKGDTHVAHQHRNHGPAVNAPAVSDAAPAHAAPAAATPAHAAADAAKPAEIDAKRMHELHVEAFKDSKHFHVAKNPGHEGDMSDSKAADWKHKFFKVDDEAHMPKEVKAKLAELVAKEHAPAKVATAKPEDGAIGGNPAVVKELTSMMAGLAGGPVMQLAATFALALFTSQHPEAAAPAATAPKVASAAPKSGAN